MDIEVFDKKSSYRTVGAECTISFHFKGAINFSIKTMELLDIKEGDHVKIWRNKLTNDWFVGKTVSNSGFNVAGKFIRSIDVVRKVFEAAGAPNAKSICFKLSEAPVSYEDMKGFCILFATKRITQ